MAKEILRDGTVLWHGLDLSSDVNSCESPYQRTEKEVTNWASEGWQEFLPGFKSGAFNFNGYLEDQAQPEEELFTRSVNVPVTVAKSRPVAEGDYAFGGIANQTQFTRQAQIGEAFGYALTMRQTQPGLQGVILARQDAVNVNGNGGPVLMPTVGASSSLHAFLHVLDVVGNLDVTVESDDAAGFLSPVSRLVFDQITDAGGPFASNVKSAPGPIADTFYRVAWTLTGTATFRVFLATT